ncbi:hypothetical protein GOP47_0009951 [Adiantum capillus-veneris]|uniref:Pentatricopeptide repeat-containing protein n=1 Tax=Adiantum capillus-veneris TaxID=13818 RepID=A0A9D4UXZ9_ADICA|nr:hypothetical protein GOP47_0009951 [Adiantum capillus-veneris]
MESLCLDSWFTPSWLDEELARNGFAQDGNRCNDHTIPPDATAFLPILRNCAKNKDLRKGTRVHDDITQMGLLEKCSDALVTMYAKCGALSKAKELHELHISRNLFSWTALISAYAQQGLGKEVVDCFEKMQRASLSPDAVTFTSILKAYGSIGAADKGREFTTKSFIRNCWKMTSCLEPHL